MKSIYSSDIFLSPNLAITRMKQLVQKHGKSKALTDGRFKKERETAITALFVLGYRLLLERDLKTDFWIGVPKNDPPDNVIVFLQKRETGRGLVKCFTNIEVFEWETHSKKTLPQAIREKLRGKNYPTKYLLICQVNRPGTGEESNVEEWFQDLQREKPGVSEVWIVSSIKNDSFDHVILRLYPSIIEQPFKLLEQLNATKAQTCLLHEMGRGIMDNPEPIDDTFLPLP